MKEIPLTQGKVALVDDDVFEWASQFKWCVLKGNRGRFYAVRTSPKDPATGKPKTIYLHREIMKPGPGEEVDHKFGNTLDDRISEMRNVTKAQNAQAFRNPKGSKSSRFRGVHWNKGAEKWQARVRVKGNLIHLGYFESEEGAARAYDKAAIESYGEFAQPNFTT